MRRFGHRLPVLLHCCHTPAHEVLFREIFLTSVPPGFEVRPHLIDVSGPGDYLSPEFLRCIRKKIDLVLDSIEAAPDATIVWSDVDIRFFSVTPGDLQQELTRSKCDILFQRESPRLVDVNTGFFVCHTNAAVRDFFRSIRNELESRSDENEQMAVNRLLAAGLALTWGHLPNTFYARTQGWPPPLRPAIYHANYTKGADGVGQKLAQFREIDRIHRLGWPAWVWSIVRRIPGRLLRGSAE